jgi:hypothetical protein
MEEVSGISGERVTSYWRRTRVEVGLGHVWAVVLPYNHRQMMGDGALGLRMNLPDESLGGRLLPELDIEWLSKTTRERGRQDERRGESPILPHCGSQM